MKEIGKGHHRIKKKSKFLNNSFSMNSEIFLANFFSSHAIDQENSSGDQNVQKRSLKQQKGIFEQFKIKYDALRKQNFEKRSEIDQLSKANKRLQIKLLNINTEFYDKELQRLQQYVDKLLEESQNYKQKFFNAENQRISLDSSLKIKQKQFLKLIKQLESQKVQNVQLKHQMKVNEKKYLDIIKTVEQLSSKSSEKYLATQKKLITTEHQLKQIQREVQTEKQKVQKVQKFKKQFELQSKKKIEKLEIQLANTKIQFQNSQFQSRQQKKQISLLNQKIIQLNLATVQKNFSSELGILRKFQKPIQYKSCLLLQFQNKKIKQENQTLKIQLQNIKSIANLLQLKLNQIQQLNQSLKIQYDRIFNDLINKKNSIQKKYLEENITLSQQLQIRKINDKQQYKLFNNLVRLNISEIQTNQKNGQFLYMKVNLEQNSQAILRNVIEQMQQSKDKEFEQLKASLTKKIEQLYNLQQQMQQLQIFNQKMKNELEIAQRKLQFQQKIINQKNQIQKFQMKSEIQSLTRKLSLAETRIQIKNREIKQKDSFIADSIIARLHKESDVPVVLTEIQRIFEAECQDELAKAESKIKFLEEKLTAVKQTATIRNF